MGWNQYIQTSCFPPRLAGVNTDVCREPDDPRLAYLHQTCFKGLLYVKPYALTLHTISHIIRNWDRHNHCFLLKGGIQWRFTDSDVANVYGLPYGSNKLPILLDEEANHPQPPFLAEMVEKYELCAVSKKNHVKDHKVRSALGRRIPITDFWRLYALYAVITMLVPFSTFSNVGYLRYLESPEIAEEYNWAGLVRVKLVEGLNTYKLKMEKGDVDRERPQGDLHCLMHMFYDLLESKKYGRRIFSCSLDRDLDMVDLRRVFPTPGKPTDKEKEALNIKEIQDAINKNQELRELQEQHGWRPKIDDEAGVYMTDKVSKGKHDSVKSRYEGEKQEPKRRKLGEVDAQLMQVEQENDQNFLPLQVQSGVAPVISEESDQPDKAVIKMEREVDNEARQMSQEIDGACHDLSFYVRDKADVVSDDDDSIVHEASPIILNVK